MYPSSFVAGGFHRGVLFLYQRKMTQKEIEDFIDSHNWRFAKTMPQMPHWYTLKKNCVNKDDERDFERFVSAIYMTGVPTQWKGRTYRYLKVGDYQYWTMDETEESTDLINRALRPKEERDSL